jgi:hypothetical protein
MVHRLLRRLCRRREMETQNLTDSMNALQPAAPLLPPDANTEGTNPEGDAQDCPPSWPNCGPEPTATDPAAVLVGRASPVDS